MSDETEQDDPIGVILERLNKRQITVEQARGALRSTWSVEDLGFARLDHDRARRRGFPEVIYGEGKTTAEIVEIFERLCARHDNVLCTRTSVEAAQAVMKRHGDAEFDARSRILRRVRNPAPMEDPAAIAVLTGGTSDLPVALEATQSAETMGLSVRMFADVGVAGLVRLLREIEVIRRSRVVICVAGMEAALPSVVAGLVDAPVIAVPTSVGYGSSFGGVAALLGCLNACSAGVSVVNIDNGFGAAVSAALIARAAP